MQSVAASKQDIRRGLRQRSKISGAEDARCSRAVCSRLRRLKEVTDVPFLAVYAARADEIDLTELILMCQEQKKGVLMPRFESHTACYRMAQVRDIRTDTVPGNYGIPEPLSHFAPAPDELVAGPNVTWLVPGLAFDELCYRLGRGAGYYDRLLQGNRGFKIGVTHDWRILPRLPHDEHDVRMDLVVSERRNIRCPLSRLQPDI